nr:hypothetical protein CFP56_22622 [Quercus suber]
MPPSSLAPHSPHIAQFGSSPCVLCTDPVDESLQAGDSLAGPSLQQSAPSPASLAPIELPPVAAIPTSSHHMLTRAKADPGGGNSCIGVVIRDSSGSPFGALSLVLPSCFSAETTEAIALHLGVLFAVEMQVSQAMFESDALSIILALNSGATGSDIGHILDDIREASSTFSHCSFHHLKRDGNRAAHSLAREAKSSGQSNIWKGISPPCILNILGDDMMYSSLF